MKFDTILVDGDIWLHRACSVARESVTFGEGEEIQKVNVAQAGAWFRTQMRALRDKLGTDNIVVALGDRERNFRKELSPTYKAQRAAGKPAGFKALEEMVEAKMLVLRGPRLEGDDILGLALTKPGTQKVCVSIDKDLLQVPGWHYNPDKDELVEITPAEGATLHLFQTLTGDRVDGYPGCPGVGPVKAARILARDTATAWDHVRLAYEKAGQTEEQALLQARLAFVLRQGYYNRATNEVKLWTPS